MSRSNTSLDTPIIVKRTSEDGPEPGARFAYVIAKNGLFIARETPLYRSCVPAREYPPELCDQAAYFEPRFPRVPRKLLERVVGFFSRVDIVHGSESAVLLALDAAGDMRILVPDQIGTLSRAWGSGAYPIGVHYGVPLDLPRGWRVIGSIHCHCAYSAFASSTDQNDETHRPGLHLVVGRIGDEPPELHAEAVTDGTRFALDPQSVIEGYERRAKDVPRAWMERVRVSDVDGARRLLESVEWRGQPVRWVSDLDWSSEDGAHAARADAQEARNQAVSAGETGPEGVVMPGGESARVDAPPSGPAGQASALEPQRPTNGRRA